MRTSLRSERAHATPCLRASARTRLLEAGHGRADHAGADLADARLLVRNAGVDDRREPVSTTSRTSMPVGTPAKSSAGIVHSGFRPTVISRHRSWCRAPPRTPTLRRRSRQPRATRPWRSRRARWSRRWRNRPCRDWRPAATEAREVEALRHLHRRGEPGVARAAHADAEIRAVAAHGGDDGGARDARAGSVIALPIAMATLRKN